MALLSQIGDFMSSVFSKWRNIVAYNFGMDLATVDEEQDALRGTGPAVKLATRLRILAASNGYCEPPSRIANNLATALQQKYPRRYRNKTAIAKEISRILSGRTKEPGFRLVFDLSELLFVPARLLMFGEQIAGSMQVAIIGRRLPENKLKAWIDMGNALLDKPTAAHPFK